MLFKTPCRAVVLTAAAFHPSSAPWHKSRSLCNNGSPTSSLHSATTGGDTETEEAHHDHRGRGAASIENRHQRKTSSLSRSRPPPPPPPPLRDDNNGDGDNDIIIISPPPTTPPRLRARIRDLVSHPAVVWDESSTFASMQKKKLGRRHLPLFDRAKKNRDDDSDSDSSSSADSDDDDDDDNRNNDVHNHNATTTNHEDHLFDQFAQAVCRAGVVARKEAFETWAAALYMHSSFFGSEAEAAAAGANIAGRKPIGRRVADIAAGHGLLAWALLLLDDEYQQNRDDDYDSDVDDYGNGSLPGPPLTAFCLDVQMPRSAERVQSSMIRQFPHLESRFDYVEGRLEQLVPHPSCLLASVHSCGILSDILAATAAEHGVPLAMVPCCHSRKPKVLEVASPHARDMYEDIILRHHDRNRAANGGGGGITDLADGLDRARMAALENAGMVAWEEYLPDIFTGKNRLIMGFPVVAAATTSQGEEQQRAIAKTTSKDRPMRPTPPSSRKGRMPPLENEPTGILPKRRFLKGFYVPCENTRENRRLVSDLAGRAAANGRKEAMRNRHHAKSPRMDISLWLPPPEEEEEEDDNDMAASSLLSENALSRAVESEHGGRIECTVSELGSVYVDPTSGRRSRSFRVQYDNNNVGEEATVLPFEDAKMMHDRLYEMIPKLFPGTECR